MLGLWALAEEAKAGTLVNLIARAGESAQKHVFVLELAGRGHYLNPEPCTVRYLERWTPDHGGGANVFSPRRHVPYRWHHLVAQKVGGRMELYMDGDRVHTRPRPVPARRRPPVA